MKLNLIRKNNKRNTKHGQRNTKLYDVWARMKQRCQNPNSDKYHIYGARGITICDDWQNFEKFYIWAINNGYQENLTIDRIDNNGNYRPENCRFITNQENCRNRRSNHLIEIFGETKSITEWSEDQRCKVSRGTLSHRINKLKWDYEPAITIPATIGNNQHEIKLNS